MRIITLSRIYGGIYLHNDISHTRQPMIEIVYNHKHTVKHTNCI